MGCTRSGQRRHLGGLRLRCRRHYLAPRIQPTSRIIHFSDERATLLILYRTHEALFLHHEDHAYPLHGSSLDALLALDDLHAHLAAAIRDTPPADHLLHSPLLAPIANQEVWAAGVTYYSSRR